MFEFADPVLAHGTANANGGEGGSTAVLRPNPARTMSDKKDPLRNHELNRRSANITQRSASSIKRYARSLGITDSRGGRHWRGDDDYSLAMRILAGVEALASGSFTTAEPVLAECRALVMEHMRQQTQAELQGRLDECERLRVERLAAFEHARNEEFASAQRWEEAQGAVDDAHVALAEVHTEIAAIRRVLREKRRGEHR